MEGRLANRRYTWNITTACQQIRFEMETSKMRYSWAIAERERMGSTPALDTFIEESSKELAELRQKLSKIRSTQR
jgi:hypothetical protein